MEEKNKNKEETSEEEDTEELSEDPNKTEGEE